MVEYWMLSAAALVAVVVLPIVGGYAYGKVKQYRSGDVSVTSTDEAMAAAQGKRMDLQERRESDEGDGS